MSKAEHARFTALVETARRYCALIDEAPVKPDWLLGLFRLLPELHAAVVALRDPGGGPVAPEGADFEARFNLFTRLRRHLGDRDRYWLEYDDPGDTAGDHRTGSLADDLTDIYFELRRGLELLDAAGPKEAAHLWEAGFEQHWGQHLVDAERQLYALKVNDRLM
ncbi:MAG TPA: DUF5063 domain-containing protein [Gammaproteobacteria bacterium]|nr:DUF5063 domain-containing protein [Gammaproteobacteria bacterium]